MLIFINTYQGNVTECNAITFDYVYDNYEDLSLDEKPELLVLNKHHIFAQINIDDIEDRIIFKNDDFVVINTIED